MTPREMRINTSGQSSFQLVFGSWDRISLNMEFVSFAVCVSKPKLRSRCRSVRQRDAEPARGLDLITTRKLDRL
jgi:hypothetical protein